MPAPSANAIKAAAAEWIARRDAGLSAREAEEMTAWLAADPRHREALQRCDSTWGALDRPYRSGAAHDLIVAVEQRVQRRRRRRVRSAVGTGALLLVAAFAWRAADPGETGHALGESSRTATVLLPAQRTLPDGSRVELNDDARITVDFGGAFRRVLLHEGEAHFEVAKDSARPFVVVVDQVEVRAVGTAFSVQRRQERVEIFVAEGRVAVNRHLEPAASTAVAPSIRADAAAAQPLALLDARDHTSVSLSAADSARPRVETLSVAELGGRLAWRAPRLEFSGTPLAEAVDLLNQHALRAAVPGQPTAHYVVDDPEIAAMRISGLFRVDSTDAFVRLLKNGFGIEATVREGISDIILRKAR